MAGVIDPTLKGKEVDLGLRSATDASPLPDGVQIVGGIDTGGRAYRLIRVNAQGGLEVSPSPGWGSGGLEPAGQFSGFIPAGINEIMTLPGWAHNAYIIYTKITRTNLTAPSPMLYINGLLPVGKTDKLLSRSLGTGEYAIAYVHPSIPAPLIVSVQVYSPDTIADCDIKVYPIVPGVTIPHRHQTVKLISNLTVAPNSAYTVDNVISSLPIHAQYTLFVASGSTIESIQLIASDAGAYNQSIIAASPPVLNGNESVAMRISNRAKYAATLITRGSSGSAVVNVACNYLLGE